jgi:hypothetical protein
MKQHSIVQAMYMSFFSKSLYQDVRKNWKGNAYPYLFVLTAIFVIPLMIKIHLGVNDFMTNDAPKITQQIPDIKIKDGQVSTPEAKKYTINDPDKGTPFAVIDTTGATKTLEPNTYFLLTKNQVITKKEDGTETRIYDLSKVQDFTLTQDMINTWAGYIKNWLALALYPFTLLGVFLVRIIQALLYALAGFIITKIMKTHFSYQSLTRLSVIAMTPVIIVDSIIGYIDINIPYLTGGYIAITLAYLVFGILVSKNNKDQIKPEKTVSQRNTPAAVRNKK